MATLAEFTLKALNWQNMGWLLLFQHITFKHCKEYWSIQQQPQEHLKSCRQATSCTSLTLQQANQLLLLCPAAWTDYQHCVQQELRSDWNYLQMTALLKRELVLPHCKQMNQLLFCTYSTTSNHRCHQINGNEILRIIILAFYLRNK